MHASLENSLDAISSYLTFKDLSVLSLSSSTIRSAILRRKLWLRTIPKQILPIDLAVLTRAISTRSSRVAQLTSSVVSLPSPFGSPKSVCAFPGFSIASNIVSGRCHFSVVLADTRRDLPTYHIVKVEYSPRRISLLQSISHPALSRYHAPRFCLHKCYKCRSKILPVDFPFVYVFTSELFRISHTDLSKLSKIPLRRQKINEITPDGAYLTASSLDTGMPSLIPVCGLAPRDIKRKHAASLSEHLPSARILSIQ
jgi:hypothetical protein